MSARLASPKTCARHLERDTGIATLALNAGHACGWQKQGRQGMQHAGRDTLSTAIRQLNALQRTEGAGMTTHCSLRGNTHAADPRAYARGAGGSLTCTRGP